MTWDRAHTLGQVGRWAILLGILGLVVVFAFGFVLAGWNSTYYSVAKDARDAAVPGTDVGNALRNIQVYSSWINGLEFLSIGLLLAGIALQLVPVVAMLAQQGADISDAITKVSPKAVAPMPGSEEEKKKAA